MRSSFIRDNKLMWILKAIIAVYQIPATWFVFYGIAIASGRSTFEAVLTTCAAIALIDALLLTSLYFLESPELSISQKVPWAISAILLVIAILVIGFEDEGATAWMPRIAVVILVFAAVFNLIVEWLNWRNDIDRKILASNRKRELDELEIHNKRMVARREADKIAHLDALNKLKDELLQLHIKRERDRLGITAPEPVIEGPEIGLLTPTVTSEQEYEGVVKLEEGKFGWYDLENNLITSTSTGNLYSSAKGANVARKRKLNQ